MKTSILTIIVLSILLAGSVLFNIFQFEIYKNDRAAIKSLSESYENLSKKTTYSIELSPSITTKNTATFGKVANVYLQYYFELDGQILDLKADSTIFITKKVIKKGEKVEK